MNDFLHNNLRKFDKLTTEQARDVFSRALDDRARFATAFNSLTLGILVCDERQRIVLANASAERLLGMPRSSSSRDPVWLVVKDEAVSTFLHDALASGCGAEGRCFPYKARGAPHRLLSFDALPLVEERRISGSLIVVEDVTQKKTREAELRRIESLASLTTLAAGVAHEIKNPLASLSIHVHLLQKMLEGGKERCEKEPCASLVPFDGIQTHLAIVNEEITRLNRIVVDFLFAVRPMDLMLIKSDVNKLLTGTIAFMQCELDDAHVACVVDLQEKIPLVEFDEKYLKQAFLNLIKNALEAMRDSAEKTLRVKTEATDAQLTVSIGDSGCGISDEHKTKIFEPYFTTKNMGTGIGLTLVFKIVREHRGLISFESKEGRGTTFVIALPVPQSHPRLLECHRLTGGRE
ncbi:MAG: GHKL domain-containing protein [Spirochaetaceae bacterium]|nr:GHKL domain-containing protein [Spirochaetaceae bacterium]